MMAAEGLEKALRSYVPEIKGENPPLNKLNLGFKKGKKGSEPRTSQSCCFCIRDGIVVNDSNGVCCCRFLGAD